MKGKNGKKKIMKVHLSPFEGGNAKKYDKWYETLKGRKVDKLEKALFLKLVKPKKGQTLLDIGCGTGHFSFWFHDLGLKVTGIDISRNMLEVAAGKIKNQEIKFIRGDAQSLPFQDKSFDLVVMITTLEFLSQPRKALEEAFRVARRKVFFGVLNRWSLLSLKRKIRALFKESIYGKAKFYSIGKLRRLLKNCLSSQAIQARISCQKTLRGAFISVVADLR